MARLTRPLSATEVEKAKPDVKTKFLFDGGGLYLEITPKGKKLWRFKYRVSGKPKLLSFGSYPDISLAEARERRQEARNKVANGADPGEMRKEAKKAQEVEEATFEVVAKEWFAKNEPVWSASHIRTVKSRLERDVYPVIGNRPISEITRGDVIALLHKVEARGVIETADRIKMYCGQVFRYALNLEKISFNPVSDMRDVISKREPGHHAAITDPKRVGELLRDIEEYNGSFVVCCALKIAPLVFVRPGELYKAEWSEMNLDGGEWNIPAARMKMKQPHLVPLAQQTTAILRELHKLTGEGKYVFPSYRSRLRPMSDVAMLAALRRMGYGKEEMTSHGWRATARTIMDEVLQIRPDFIEHQLAHAVKDPNGRAYNRTAHLPERKKMMQQWADYLDSLKEGGKAGR
jgi:integrase